MVVRERVRRVDVTLAYFTVLVLTAVVAWWLSGFDNRLLDQTGRAGLIRRTFRCALTLALVGWMFPDLEHWWRYSDPGSGVSYLVATVPLALIWCGCVSELCARGFHRLIEPNDGREPELERVDRELDTLARLVQEGRTVEAVRLCHKLEDSRECSGLALEALLTRLGAQDPAAGSGPGRRPSLLVQARQLRHQGRFEEAASKLRSLLAQEEDNLAGTLLLIRIYAQDFKHRERALEVLRKLQGQPYAPRDFLEYARRSIDEWSREGTRSAEPGPGIESLLLRHREWAPPQSGIGNDAAAVDELLANGYLGTAVERLEQQVLAQPGNFDLALKLAEAHGHYCRNLSRAKKIVSEIAGNPAFSPEQIARAQTKLQEWRAGVPGL